jgi:hypothetical protein
MIGYADSGRLLTILVRESAEPNDWHVMNGWPSSPGERARYEGTNS